MSDSSKNKKIKPLGDRVLIKRSEQATSKGGILLPDTAQEKPREGKVLATGPGKHTDTGIEPMMVNVGDRVLFSSYAGTEVKNDEEELLIMSEKDILGILT